MRRHCVRRVLVFVLLLGGTAWSDSLVAHWKFDEAAGYTAYDSSVNSNDGTMYNMDSSDWITGSKIWFVIDAGSYSTGKQELTYTAADLVGNWHHIVCYRNGTLGKLYLYYDGVLKAYTSSVNTGNIDSPGENLYIACSSPDEGLGVKFSGKLDDIRIYNYILSQAEINALIATQKAGSPSPEDGQQGVSITADLTWTPGVDAVSHDVYFGTSAAAVTNATRLTGDIDGDGTVAPGDLAVMAEQWLGSPAEPYADVDGDGKVNLVDLAIVSAEWADSANPAFRGNQTSATYAPGTMAAETTYYWRIDEVNSAEPASPWTGDIWSFRTESLIPGQAGNPSPSHGAGGVTIDADLSWTAGANATSHDVYFGTISPGVLQGNQTGVTFDLGTMEEGKTYYWRINEVNTYGTTTGAVWHFTTAEHIIKIMPLGDSITQGGTTHDNYRHYLWNKLQFYGHNNINFVGSHDVLGYDVYDSLVFDKDHEGHGGWTTDEILNGGGNPAGGTGNLNAWLTGLQATNEIPDIVLMHLGTNDVNAAGPGYDHNITIGEMEDIIDLLRSYNPNVTILVAKVIPCVIAGTPGMDGLNALIPSLDTYETATSEVIIVDHNTGFLTSWLADEIHPNATGAAKMSDRWYDALTSKLGYEPIDRYALVTRHNPVINAANAFSPLSVGNGGFAFTADITGLQSFPDFYSSGIPLCIQSDWGWHTFDNPNGYNLEDILVDINTYGRLVKYASITSQHAVACEWLRANPHRLGLARVGLKLKKSDGSSVILSDCTNIDQQLDLWRGVLTSRFKVGGQDVQVQTCCHPDNDMIAVRIESDLIAANRLSVTIDFPYGSGSSGPEPGDWNNPLLHQTTTIIDPTATRVDFQRTLDDDVHYVTLQYSSTAAFNELSAHHYELDPPADSTFEFAVEFSRDPIVADLPAFSQSLSAVETHWQNFWSTGGAIDLSASTNPLANELERRIVLSQYLTAIQSAGDMAPQETGLTFNSWYGTPHLEMHWWHEVHFVLWGRAPLFERSLDWYQSILPMAQETATRQGYTGARWSKMVGPEGEENPSSIGTFIVWNQPHPIYFAELGYREHPDQAWLEQYSTIVFETAEFMASFMYWNDQQQRYVLGPPVIPAQERYTATATYNPTFELEYWRWGLQTAQVWRERLGLPRNSQWDHVIDNFSQLPVSGGLYLANESTPDTWTNDHWNDHPSMLMAYGFLKGPRVDVDTMSRTLDKVMEKWNWSSTWGWDFPMIAMTATRVGKPQTAIDALMMNTAKNTYLPNGHNCQYGSLPIYLPGNGGLLSVTAMMAAGWDGAPAQHAPGFPNDGTWQVHWEGLKPMP